MHSSKKYRHGAELHSVSEDSEGGYKLVRFGKRKGVEGCPRRARECELGKRKNFTQDESLGESDSESRDDGSDNRKDARSGLDTSLDGSSSGEDSSRNADAPIWSSKGIEEAPVHAGDARKAEKGLKERRALREESVRGAGSSLPGASEGDCDGLPESVIRGALSYEEMESQNRLKEEEEAKRRKERELEENRLEEEIASKPVQVVHLYDKSGLGIFEERKRARIKAEKFLKDHFWGARLERMRNDQFMDQKVIGPAVHFQVPNARERSLKRKRKVAG
ncbi:uncharacterized protein LOC126315422 [Schistocerca gregaria]|uniref:uncharacterized protein LOC126315422 n=1 Tax=Schistocerca gregaria TaxID=7010 RepID=UPI00211EDA64|nr:uncharacterized protein LOC126315422 [Schistocerca gregaria]